MPRDSVLTNTARLPTVAEIFRPTTLVQCSSTRSVLDIAIELLPTIDNDLEADLVEALLLGILDKEEELCAVRLVLSRILALSHEPHVEIVRLQKRVADLLDARRQPRRLAA